jgi:drug/metabolite transporter (DMT)-like permease
VIVALVAAAAVAHAAWNIAIKRAGADGAVFLWLTFVLGAVLFVPIGVITIAESGTQWLPLTLVSGALQVGYFFLLQHAYRKGDVSVVYPLARGTAPLLSVVFAIILLGERPGIPAIIGAVVVVTGVVVIGLAGGRRGAQLNRPGVLWGSAVGVIIAVYTLWDSNAVINGGMPPLGYYWAVVSAALLLSPVVVRQRATVLPTIRRHWPTVLIVGLLSPLAYVLVLAAVQLAPVSIIAPAREVSVVLVSLGGWLWLGERNPVQRLIGSVIVLLGVGLLSL